MDFKKIARIFIIAFVALNIYLIIGIFERQDIQYTPSQPEEEDLLTNMAASDIEVPELNETETEEQEVFSLQADAHNLLEQEMENEDLYTGTLNDDGSYYDSFPSDPILLEGTPADGFTEADYTTVSEFVASEEVMFGEEYTFSHFEAENNRFVFYQVVDGLPIADGTSEISLFVNADGEIYAYEQTYAGPVSRQGDELELISNMSAIETLFLNNEIREGSTVETPVLTYRRALQLEDLSMYSPIWMIGVTNSSERNTFRVDAVNGTIIRQPTSSSEENGEGNNENTETDNNEESNDGNTNSN